MSRRSRTTACSSRQGAEARRLGRLWAQRRPPNVPAHCLRSALTSTFPSPSALASRKTVWLSWLGASRPTPTSVLVRISTISGVKQVETKSGIVILLVLIMVFASGPGSSGESGGELHLRCQGSLMGISAAQESCDPSPESFGARSSRNPGKRATSGGESAVVHAELREVSGASEAALSRDDLPDSPPGSCAKTFNQDPLGTGSTPFCHGTPRNC